MPIITLDDNTAFDRHVLGGKAWSIQHMRSLGIPVPPAFVLTTDECQRYIDAGRQLPDDILAALPEAVAKLESITGRTFGRGPKPLLVSVRSGAAISMPGMMDTILNLGMTAEVEQALAIETGDASFAENTRHRFEKHYFDIVGIAADTDPWRQLEGAIKAVFDSWQSRRAIAYRAERGITSVNGTAVTVQAMVFGNLDDRSGTGVLFSRNPATGASEPFGEWLARAQGEDVVSGSHDPLPLSALAHQMPEVHDKLMRYMHQLENDARDVQDIEFTVETGRLWLLQTRNAKRTPRAAVRLAVAMQREGLISKQEAVARVSPEQLANATCPHIDPRARSTASVLARGNAASPGLCSGLVVVDTVEAEERAGNGEAIILARPTTDPEDVPAMMVVAAVVTELGGSTSHAAVVSRELGVPCIVGCGVGSLAGLDGRTVTVDAESGEIFDGALPIIMPASTDDEDLLNLKSWAS